MRGPGTNDRITCGYGAKQNSRPVERLVGPILEYSMIVESRFSQKHCILVVNYTTF